MDGLDRLIAARLRSALDEKAMRQEDLARAMTALGLRWTPSRVTQVVTGRGTLSLLEIAGLCAVLQRSVRDLVGEHGTVDLPQGHVDLADLWAALLSTATALEGVSLSGSAEGW